jgi:hypothetical protein
MRSKITLTSLVISLVALSTLTQPLYAVHIGHKDDVLPPDYSNSPPYEDTVLKTIIIDFQRGQPNDLVDVGRQNNPKNAAEIAALASDIYPINLKMQVRASENYR